MNLYEEGKFFLDLNGAKRVKPIPIEIENKNIAWEKDDTDPHVFSTRTAASRS